MSNLLLFINPISGKGNSLSVFKKVFLILKNKNILNIHITKKETNIQSLLEKTYVEQYDLIIGIGGDGMMFQIINALHNLQLSIPIAQIPTGSGNGYFKSLTYQTNQLNTIDTAIDIINRNNRFLKTDLLHITNNEQTLNIYSKLSISWGFISCVDIYTEWMRKLGDFRFTLGVLWNIYKKTNYKGVLEYKLYDDWYSIKSDQFIYFWACNTSHVSHDLKISPDSKIDDGLIDISYIIGPISRCELLYIFITINTTKLNHPKVGRIRTKEFKLTTENGLLVVDGEQINNKQINVVNLNKASTIIY